MMISRIVRSLSKSSRSTLFNGKFHGFPNQSSGGGGGFVNRGENKGLGLGFLNSHQSSIDFSSPNRANPSISPIYNPNFARFFSTAVASNTTNYEIKLGKGDNDDQKNVLRPLSPHLPIYKPQSHSLQSILNRVSGMYLTGLFLAFHLAYVKAGAICLTYSSFYEAVFYSSKLSVLSLEIAALATVYHLYHGIRHV